VQCGEKRKFIVAYRPSGGGLLPYCGCSKRSPVLPDGVTARAGADRSARAGGE
jgi:hypothetical protein